METAQHFETALLQFLLELVRGHWNAVLPLDKDKEEVSASHRQLEALVGLLAEELRQLLFHKAFVNPHKGYRFIAQGLLLLDQDFHIAALTQAAAEFLEQSPVALYRSHFIRLLEEESADDFHVLALAMQGDVAAQPVPVVLVFRHAFSPKRADAFIVPVLYGEPCLAVQLFGLQPLPVLPVESPEALPVQSTVVQQVYDFILSHREGPLPSARELARRFGTNEFELKKDFRALFGQSIYQVYMQQRLQRALILIRTTRLALTDVALQSGFDDYSSFAKAFRKHYGCTPSQERGRL